MNNARSHELFARASQLLPGESTVAWDGDTAIFVCNYDGDYYALEDRCSHEDFELSSGTFDGEEASIECVLHGARFDVRAFHDRVLGGGALPLSELEARVDERIAARKNATDGAAAGAQ